MTELQIPLLFKIECNKSKLTLIYSSYIKFFYFENVYFSQKNNTLLIYSSVVNVFVIRKIISNFILDVFSKVNVKLEIVGFNYRAVFDSFSNSLLFYVGYTNVIKLVIPSTFNVSFLDKKNKILQIQATDRLLLLPYAMEIRNLKRPNIYTGHGIRFYKEKVFLKQIKK